MPTSDPYSLYELSPEEFERLCMELLMAEDPRLTISAGEAPRWIDAIGVRGVSTGSRSVAIEAKHRRAFHPEGLRLFLERLARESTKFDEYIFITSSPIRDAHRQIINSQAARSLNAEVKLLGKDDILLLLRQHHHVAAKYFKTARVRQRKQKIAALVSSLIAAVSAGVTGNLLYDSLFHRVEPSSKLTEQVKSVENSLDRLNDLELSLKSLKNDLESKSAESARITKEYEEAMKLKALTTEQLEQVKKAVSGQSGTDIFLNYFFGFLLGVAGSVLATIITDKWKQRKELDKPYA
jgi:tetrahydromethanopterin S-methyltransferase subunit B